jgi:bifunctional non-homologous end joining protein LigD
MQATLVDQPFHREGWIYEEKYDGWRMLAYKDGDRVQLLSRSGRDHAARFPELVAALRQLRDPQLILDAEVVRFDERLVSRFEWLRSRAPGDLATPPVLMAFDCLWRVDRDLRREPLWYRRVALEEAIEGGGLVLPARRLDPNGLQAWAQVLAAGWEGMVGKNEVSTYQAGRSLQWLKVKTATARDVVARRFGRR